MYICKALFVLKLQVNKRKTRGTGTEGRRRVKRGDKRGANYIPCRYGYVTVNSNMMYDYNALMKNTERPGPDGVIGEFYYPFQEE